MPWALAFARATIWEKAPNLITASETGTQGFQSLALGPRFRGGDDWEKTANLLTPAKAEIQGAEAAAVALDPRFREGDYTLLIMLVSFRAGL